jgi:excinuclease ABC subunit C
MPVQDMPDLPDDETDEPDFGPELLDLSGPATVGEAGSLAAGAEVIKSYQQTLPNHPGVYRMLNQAGEVLYVGKAKSLKKRVASYVREGGHSNRISRMIALTASMEFITTQTETEALLLEANLIKQLKPHFNVLLRDDKSFAYILLARDHEAPQLVKHRGARQRKGSYFGPFASTWAVNRTMTALQRAFLIRTCSDSYYENRTRPCLLYQIKRCAGPCTGEIDLQDYAALVSEAEDFMRGRSNKIRQHLSQDMQKASDALEFETAARLRDRLSALAAVQSSQDINPHSVEEADVIALHAEAGLFSVQVFFYRHFQNWGNRAYFPRADKSLAPEDVLQAFVAQFYDDKPPPKLILLSHQINDQALLAEALSGKVGHKVEISVPQRGEKRDVLDHAQDNARMALGRRLADTSSQQKLLKALAEALGLPSVPRRIEVFDNSHISGNQAVGGMIVAGVEGFSKAHYRVFNIKSTELTPGDDYAMMREVLTRRLTRLLKEATPPVPPKLADGGELAETMSGDESEAETGGAGVMPLWPDLILIDGGQGQLDVATSVAAELGVTDIAFVGVAKGVDRDAGRETFIIPGRAPFRLPPRDPALYFIQRLRDEAHRFAIGSHRARRSKALTRSSLDEISGVGPARKRALLHHFGSAKAVERASYEDLLRAPGINQNTAKLIYAYFHEDVGPL